MASPLKRVVRLEEFAVIFGGFLDLFAVSLILPPLSSHLKSLRLSAWQRGCVLSTYGLVQFVSGPLVGGVSDRAKSSNDKKMIFVVCAVCSGISYSLLGFSSSSLLWAFLARVLAGVFKHSQTLSKAFIVDYDPGGGGSDYDGKKTTTATTTALARFNGASSVGFIVGPIIGGHILECFPTNGFSICCQLAAFLFLLNALFTHFCLDDDVVVENADRIRHVRKGDDDDDCDDNNVVDGNSIDGNVVDANVDDVSKTTTTTTDDNKVAGVVSSSSSSSSSSSYSATASSSSSLDLWSKLVSPFARIGQRRMWDLFLAKFLGGCSVLVFRYEVNQRLTDYYGATPKSHGYVTSYGAIAAALFSTFLVDRLGPSLYPNRNTSLLYHTTLLHAATLALLSVAPNLPFYILGITLLSFTNATNRVTFTQVTVERGGGTGSASLIGLCQSVMSVSRIFSPIAGGVVSEETLFAAKGPPLLAVALAVASAATCKAFLVPKQQQQQQQQRQNSAPLGEMKTKTE